MVVQNIDGVSFQMKEAHDFSFLSKYGQVFCVFSQNDSGNISFGTNDGEKKYFIKIAGTKTMEACVGTSEAIKTLKAAIPLYIDLAHPGLIKLVEHFAHGDLYVAVFAWTEGECLFDHWNFESYNNSPHLIPPRKRFKELPCDKKLNAFATIFNFLTFTESKGYVAVDFYDGSIIYDFQRDVTMICDIDLFRKIPAINDMGENYYGTKRLKAPEEYVFGAEIDSATNVFTLGALLMNVFGSFTDDETSKTYEENKFFPCRFETWELSETLYRIASKAVSPNRLDRFNSMKIFFETWKANYTV